MSAFHLRSRQGPLLPENPDHYRDTKDPCVVFDGTQWHLFGSGGSSISEEWKLLHATAPSMEGPWTKQDFLELDGVEGAHVAAPGVVFEDGIFHMFVQRDFMALGGTVEHLVSTDAHHFSLRDTPLKSIPDSPEAGLYDPHPAVIAGQKYITYSGNRIVGHPDLYLAKSVSNTWDGPWERLGTIVTHAQVPHHNQLDSADYEWGLEGSQLIELPSGIVILNAVCFLPYGARGTRQRIFFAAAEKPQGPYRTLGPVLQTIEDGWEDGENGHAAGFVSGDTLQLFYQSRSHHHTENQWRYGHAVFDLAELEQAARDALAGGSPMEVVASVDLEAPKPMLQDL
jgi:hypothetical protein